MLGEFSYRKKKKALRNNFTLELRQMFEWKLDGNGSESYPEAIEGLCYLLRLYFASCSRRCSSVARADHSKGDELGFLMDKVTLHLFHPILHNLWSPPWRYALGQSNPHFIKIRVSETDLQQSSYTWPEPERQ